MAIKPREPRLGPVDFNHSHGDAFIEPPHLIKRQAPGVGVDPSMLPTADIDTSYDPDEILATETIPQVRPIFLGARKAWADQRIEKSNDRLQDLTRLQSVLRYAGRAILSSNSYTHNNNRPSTQEEIRAVTKLGKLHTKRRRSGTRVHSTSRAMTPPVHATRAESKETSKNRGRHLDAQDRVNRHNEEFRAVIRRPSEEAEEVIARRNQSVAKREALNQAIAARDTRREERKAKVEAIGTDLTGAAHALAAEIAERHQDSLALTKEQAERLAAASMRAGRLVVNETVATAEFTAKGSKYTAEFYAEVAKGAANIYWQGAKRIAKGAQTVTKKAGSKIKRK